MHYTIQLVLLWKIKNKISNILLFNHLNGKNNLYILNSPWKCLKIFQIKGELPLPAFDPRILKEFFTITYSETSHSPFKTTGTPENS